MSQRANLPNPYSVGSPAKKYFVNREEILDEIEANLGTSSLTRQNYAIVGHRQIGKTSLVLKLQERLRSSMPVSYLTLQKIQDRSEETMYRELLKPVKRQLEENGYMSLMTKWFTFEDQDDLTPPFRFNEDMEALNKVVLRTPDIPRIVFILDEAEVLQEIGGPSMLGFLRSIMQNLVGLAFVVVGSQALSKMVQDYTSPFYNVFLSRSLKSLPEDAARQLIQKPIELEWGIKFEEPAVETIIRKTGNHPHLIQLLCYEICEYLRKRPEITIANEQLVREVITELIENWTPNLEQGDYFSGIWETDPRSKLIMLILAWAEEPIRFSKMRSLADDFLKNTEIKLRTEEIERALNDLESKLAVFKVQTNSPWKKYSLAIDLVHDWTRIHGDLDRIIEELQIPEVRLSVTNPAENLELLNQEIQQRREQIEFLKKRLAEATNQQEIHALKEGLTEEEHLLGENLIRKKELETSPKITPSSPLDIDQVDVPESVQEEVNFLKKLLDQHRRNLRLLNKQRSVYGVGEAPLHLLNQRYAIEAEISNIQERLNRVLASAKALPDSEEKFNYAKGLEKMRILLEKEKSEMLIDFLSLEARLLENLTAEQKYGSDSTIRAERNRILSSFVFTQP